MIYLKKLDFTLFLSVLFFVSLFNSNATYCQNDSLQAEIKNYKDDYAFITKGRKLMSDYLAQGDFNKVKKIKDYLLENYASSKNNVFYPSEYYLILFLVNDYDELLSAVDHPVMGIRYPNWKTGFFYDDLWQNLVKKTRSDVKTIEKQLKNSDLSDIDKDFLMLLLKYLIKGSEETYPEITQDSINVWANGFLKKYPESNYTDMVKKSIKFELVPSDWGFSVSFFSGYGLFTKDVKNYIKNNVPVGVGFDVCYKRFALYLRDYIGFTHLKKDLPYSLGVWEKGSSAQVMIPEVSLGYYVKEGKHYKVAPFAGIAYTGIIPVEVDEDKNPNLSEADRGTTTFSVGVNLDVIPFVNLKSNKPESGYVYLKIRYAYGMTSFGQKYQGFEGNIHYITVGIGIMSRNVKRKY